MAEDTDLEGKLRAKILQKARARIGTSYDKMDCSHMVQSAYEEAGLKFPYTETKSFQSILIGKYFDKTTTPKPGDLILYPGHVGIYDPDGCSDVQSTECKRMGEKSDSMRILSARSGKNMGVEYGQSSWFGKGDYLVWKDFVKNSEKPSTA